MPATMPKFSGAQPGKHLGRLKPTPEQLRKVIPLAPFLKRYGAAPPPDSVDYMSRAPKALSAVLGNSEWGDCTIAATMHGGTLARAVVPGGTDVPATDAEAVNAYHRICGPGDPGCYIPNVLDALRDQGITMAGRVARSDGYASLSAGDELLAKLVVYLLGGIHLGINLPRAWYTHASDSDVWDVTDTDIVGGHSVQVIGYEPRGLRISTWGKKPLMTWAAYSNSRWVEERYAILHQDWYTQDGLDAHGINVTALRAALDAVKNGQVPVIPDGPTPTPTPPPTPTPTPPADLGTLNAVGFLNLGGQQHPVSLFGQIGATAGRRGAPNWWQIVGDVATIVRDVGRKDWSAVAADAAKLLADLGIVFAPAEMAQFVRALHEQNKQHGHADSNVDWR